MGFRGGRPRAAVGGPGRHARAGRPPSGPDGSRPPLSAEPAGPPLGTVTCLFSDIEGSTRLELAIGTGAYRSILERHRVLLRDAFTRHGGWEEGTEGDSFFVIFRAATDAVAAAADAQRAMDAEPWPDAIPVRVRMGLHTGELEATSEGVIGVAINRTARITGAAHGGQVLLSDATRALVADALPPGVTLRDLGEHRLKDLRAPERLSQLVIDGVPSDFAPPRSLDARPNNLPTQLTSFVGRDRELAEAGALLRSTRLLTFTGPGGTGKTRLSMQVAAAAADEHPDGVWFVALEAVRDPALVIPTIARMLGVADSAARPALDALVDELAGRRILLVLDNLEQVVDAGPILADLLRRCPDLRILATSRIPLHVSGEQEYPVPGLPTPPDPSRLSEVERLNLPREVREPDVTALEGYEAIRLFVTRAGAVRPGFALTPANATAVAAIVARLHGMPLAIELAAARSKLLPPDRILDRLEHHLELLTAGSRDVPARQQTLRGAIAWSYDLLDDGARRLLDRLSVFRGGFDLGMAEAVCGPAADVGGDVLDRLGELIDHSLVRLDERDAEAPRGAMLETIREFGAEMLAARDEATAVADRHAAALTELAEAAAPHLSGADQRRWLDRLERDHDNLRAALDHATARPEPPTAVRLAFALWRFWQQRGYLNEARMRLEAMAAMGWDLVPADAVRFAEALGGIAYWQNDLPATTQWYDEQLRVARVIGDPATVANALFNRSYADLVQVMGGRPSPDHLAAGRAMLQEALALYQGIGDRRGEADILWGLGSAVYFTGDAASAEAWYQRSLELHRETGNRTMEAWSLHMLAQAQVAQRRFGDARDVARHALRHFYEAGDIAGVILVLDDLAIVAVNEGDEVRGGRLWGAARRLQEQTGTSLADYIEQNEDLYRIPAPYHAISKDVLAALAAEGAAMGLDEVVAYALEANGGTPAPTHEERA